MPLEFAHVQLAAPGTTGTQNVTISGFGVPDAVIAVYAGTSGGFNAVSRQSVGFWDGSNQVCVTSFSNDNVATQTSYRGSSTSHIVALIPTGAGGFDEVARVTGTVLDGIQLTFDIASSSEISYLFIKGVNAASVFTKELSAGSTDHDVTLTHEPHALFVLGCGLVSPAENSAGENVFAFGVGHWDGFTTKQFHSGFADRNSVNPSQCGGQFSDDSISSQSLWGSIESWKATFSRPSANTARFTTTTTSTGNDVIFALALELSDPNEFSIGTNTSPTVQGTKSIVGAGFKPAFVGVLQTVASTPDTSVVTSYRFGFGTSDGVTDFVSATRSAHAASPTKASSYTGNHIAAALTGGADTLVLNADLQSFDTNGFTLDYTVTDSTARYFGWFAVKSSETVSLTTEAAVATGLLPQTLGGTQDFTVAGFGTPDAAIILCSNANTNPGTGSPQSSFQYSIGFWTEQQQACCGMLSLDGVADTFGARTMQIGDVVAQPLFGSQLVDPTQHNVRASASAIIDGLRLEVTEDNTGASRYTTVILIKGVEDLHCDWATLENSALDVIDPGFKPDLVLFAQNGGAFDPDYNKLVGLLNFGAAHNDSLDVVRQACVSIYDQYNESTSQASSAFSADHCLHQVTAQVDYSVTASFPINQGFRLSSDSDPGSDRFIYLALKLISPDDAFVDVINSETDTGTQAYTGIGFTPDVVGLVAGLSTAVDVRTLGGSFSFGAADANGQQCLLGTIEDNVSISFSRSNANLSNVLEIRADDNSLDTVALLNSFDSDGFTLDYTDPSASARKVLAFALGSASAGGITGQLAATEVGSDGASLDGQVLVAGNLTATEVGSDGASLDGQVLVAGNLTATEVGSDTADLNGNVLPAGSAYIDATETGSDSADLVGSVVVTGTLSATEVGSDGASLDGQVLVAGNLTATEVGSDTADLNGNVLPTGGAYINATESGSDTADLVGTVRVVGTLSVTEVGSDTADLNGSAPTVIEGTLDVVEAGTDTAQLVGQLRIEGQLDATETGPDTGQFRQTQNFIGNLDATEVGGDVANLVALGTITESPIDEQTIDQQYRLFGVNAVYTSAAGLSRVVRVLIDIEPSDQPGADVPGRAPTYRIALRTSEVARPDRGAVIQTGRATYQVDGYEVINLYEYLCHART